MSYAFLALIPFIVIVLFVFINANWLQHIDNLVTLEVITWRSPALISLLSWVTILANPTSVVITVLITAIIAYMISKQIHFSLWIICTNIIGSLALNPLVKNIFQRSRPDESFRLVQETSYSFPSGHSFASMVAFGCLIIIIVLFIRSSFWRKFLSILCGAIIFLIGFSRIFLGVHYLTDVIGGFSLGLFWLLLFYSLHVSRMSSLAHRERN